MTPKSLGCRICRRESRPDHWQRHYCTTNRIGMYVSAWWIIQPCCGNSTYRNVSDDRESKMPRGSSTISLISKFLMMHNISINDYIHMWFFLPSSNECWARESCPTVLVCFKSPRTVFPRRSSCQTLRVKARSAGSWSAVCSINKGWANLRAYDRLHKLGLRAMKILTGW